MNNIARHTLLLLIFIACHGAQNDTLPDLKAKEMAQKGLSNMTGFEEPLWPDPTLYKIDDVADVDGDGLYEVALTESVEGSMGQIGGIIFQLNDGKLSYIKSSRIIQRGRGNTVFKRKMIIVYSYALGPNDPYCCPSYRVAEYYKLDKSKNFILMSADTTLNENQ